MTCVTEVWFEVKILLSTVSMPWSRPRKWLTSSAAGRFNQKAKLTSARITISWSFMPDCKDWTATTAAMDLTVDSRLLLSDHWLRGQAPDSGVVQRSRSFVRHLRASVSIRNIFSHFSLSATDFFDCTIIVRSLLCLWRSETNSRPVMINFNAQSITLLGDKHITWVLL